MKKIKLTQNKYALIDDEDFEYLNQWKWCYHHSYAIRSKQIDNRKKYFRMHRELIKVPLGMVIDHINGDSLDNRKENLRACTVSQNAMNAKIKKDTSSNIKGIYFFKNENKYKARITINGRSKHLGVFQDIKNAISAYNNAAKEYFKKFAKLIPT